MREACRAKYRKTFKSHSEIKNNLAVRAACRATSAAFSLPWYRRQTQGSVFQRWLKAGLGLEGRDLQQFCASSPNRVQGLGKQDRRRLRVGAKARAPRIAAAGLHGRQIEDVAKAHGSGGPESHTVESPQAATLTGFSTPNCRLQTFAAPAAIGPLRVRLGRWVMSAPWFCSQSLYGCISITSCAATREERRQ